MSKSNETQEYNPQNDPQFSEDAMEMLMDLGLNEDEADYELNDFLF